VWAGALGELTDIQLQLQPGQDYPIVLAQNEGLIVYNGGAVWGAAGVITVNVDIDWTEILAADYLL
jgi:hypothetical protein